MKLGTISGGQNITRIAQRLSAYIPKSLAVHVLRGDAPTAGYEKRLQAASLFCDLSGFSIMANELAADGPRGAEELNRILLMTFTAMINAIHNAGGVVSHFHGDAMMVYFPDDDEQAAERALACAQFMQNLIQGGYSQVIANRPGNKQTIFELSMKVGVGYGDCLEVIVGAPHESLEFIVAGNAIDEAVAAESHAQSGQVFATDTVLRKASLPAVDPYRLVTEVLPVPYAQTSIHWDAYNSEQLWQLANLAAAFVPDALHERITANNAYFVAEHRPATSMFVRYEGINYSQPQAGQQLREYYEWARQIVTRFGGENSRINRVLTGDKGSLLHIIFGAPVAPEAPEQALHCALTLQEEKPSFITSQQIGVATGQVFACAVGSQNRREYTIVGDVVNLSSRLMTRCVKGQVLTDGVTANRVKNQIEFNLIGQERFKGFTEPIQILEAVEAKEVSSPAQSRFQTNKQSLFWRKEEQQQLLDELEQTRQGHHRAVVIWGSTSAEQTRLTNLAAGRWLAHNGRLLAGMGQQHTADIPFGIWQPVWRDFFNLSSEMSNADQIRAVMTQMKHYNPHFTKEDVWLWCNQIGLSVPPAQGVEWGLEKRLDGMILMTQMCFRAAAIEAPLLIVLENLQWIDPYSLRLLNSVAPQWQHAPIMLLMTFTPSPKLNLSHLPEAIAIPLEELNVTAGRAMVKELLAGHEPPLPLLRHLGLTETDGVINPIFLEESINMMRDDGILQITDQVHLDEAGLAQLRIPDNVQSLLRARFDRISAAGRTLLQAASVIGRQFDIDTLTQTISNLSNSEAEPLLDELREARLISAMNSGQKMIYYFNDDIFQEIAYESIPFGRRQRWHAAVADWLFKQNRQNLQPLYPVLAYHYGQTDLHQRGLQFALAAAKDVQTIIAPQAAIEFYNIAESHLNALDDPQNWHK
ncbi:MAG: AAA family ATPase, partial [Anaerolineales bacterium]|nr:AAA family ATPase [Anaerolineales bacterium]